jgi:hypothetical protein
MMEHGSGTTERKVRQSMILGLRKLEPLLKKIGLRKDINIKLDYDNISSPLSNDDNVGNKNMLTLKFN